MELNTFELLKTAATIVVAGFSVYYAIKRDLAVHAEKLTTLEKDVKRVNGRVDIAHSRIDTVLLQKD